MSQTPRLALLYAGIHLFVHAVAFLLSAIALVYIAAGLSLSPFVTVPLTIGSLSISPVVSRRALRRLGGQHPGLKRVHRSTPVSTN